MKQHIETQYDDDLTIGSDAHDDSYYSDGDDIFEFSTDDESPISRLKSLILSIDWEITDDVLLQFNEELIDLRGIWAGDTINLVYVQALEKISKYIYQNKAESHPNAIKLLLTLYYNLEKIVSSQELSEKEKKVILLEDVKRFENLKRQIAQKPQSVESPKLSKPEVTKAKKEASREDELLNLKAIVLGIDWEITDQDLNDLRREVVRLEERFAESRPKLILLQGIGTLGAYIKVKKSNAHADAFGVLHLFYESLEKIVKTPMSLEEEKSVLFPAVEKFNSFKALLGPTISPESITREEEDAAEDEYSDGDAKGFAPALADVSEEEAVGFQADVEARALGLHDTSRVSSHIDDFFGEPDSPKNFQESSQKIDVEPELPIVEAGQFDFSAESTAAPITVDRDKALQGVDVEGDDEDIVLDTINAVGSDAFLASDTEQEIEIDTEEEIEIESEEDFLAPEAEIVDATDSLFPDVDEGVLEPVAEIKKLDKAIALKGVDVETDADDDSDELSLPMEGEELAPALAALDEESLFSAKTLEVTPVSGSVTDEIVETLDDLFLDNELSPAFKSSEPEALIDTGRELDKAEGETFEGPPAGFPDWLEDDAKEIRFDTPVGIAVDDEETAPAPALSDEEIDDILKAPDDIKELLDVQDETEAQEDSLSSFFTESDLELSAKQDSENDAFFESFASEKMEEKAGTADIEDQIESLFQTAQDNDKSEEEHLLDKFPESLVAYASEPIGESEFQNIEREEEVVFQLIEEDPEVVIEESPPVSESLISSLAQEEFPGRAFESADGIAPNAFPEESYRDSDIYVADDFLPPVQPESIGVLGDLRVCIDSLGVELDDKIIAGLFKEINMLRQKWVEKPMEKTFLQLLSTITQHIESYRYEASSDAYGLLNSVYHALSRTQAIDLYVGQELLLAETLKVLEWQQGMLARQAVKKGEQLTFADPVRTEKEIIANLDAQHDFDEVLQSHEGDSGPAVLAQGAAIKVAKTGMPSSLADLSNEAFAEDLKNEIATLRQTLQFEIAALRKELKGE